MELCVLYVCLSFSAMCGRRIQSLTRIPPGLGYWAKGPWETSRRLFGGALGGLFHVLGVSWRGPGEGQKGPGEALEASWRPLGDLLEASWSSKGRLVG